MGICCRQGKLRAQMKPVEQRAAHKTEGFLQCLISFIPDLETSKHTRTVSGTAVE